MFSLATGSGKVLTGPAVLGSLSFTALAGPSAFVPLTFTNVIGIKTDGTLVGNSGGQPGRVVLIGLQPLLESSVDSNATRVLIIYGNPGSNYQLTFNTNLNFTNWQAAGSVLMTNLELNLNPDQVSPTNLLSHKITSRDRCESGWWDCRESAAATPPLQKPDVRVCPHPAKKALFVCPTKSPGHKWSGLFLFAFRFKQGGLRHFRKLAFSFGVFPLAGTTFPVSGRFLKQVESAGVKPNSCCGIGKGLLLFILVIPKNSPFREGLRRVWSRAAGPVRPRMMWSRISILSTWPARIRSRVTLISASLGVGSPLG